MLSNFKLVEVLGTNTSTWKFRATVDQTTKNNFYSKAVIINREIYRVFEGAWYFVDNGEYCNALEVDKLVRSLEAKEGKMLAFC